MLNVALVFAGLAALVHVYIFWLEALVFETTGRKAFGVTAEQAAIMKPWAYNQGFYNLFLAIGTAVGIGLALACTDEDKGVALVAFGTGTMLAAALVLITSDRSKARGAVVQGLFPLLTLASLVAWCLS
jgi:putative membrane protein